VATIPSIASSTSALGTGTTSSTRSLTLPATINAGDLLLIYAINDDSTDTYQFNGQTPPSGFTFLKEIGSSNADTHIGLWWKIADGTEDSSSVTITAQSSDDMCAVCLRIIDADTTNPIGIVGGGIDSASTASLVIPAITTVNDDSLALYFLSSDGADCNPFGQPTGWTELGEYEPSGGTPASTVAGAIGYKSMATAGDTGTATVSFSATDGGIGFQMSINPVGVPNTGYMGTVAILPNDSGEQGNTDYWGCKWTAPKSGAITGHVYMQGTSSGSNRMAIYADSAGAPGALLADSSSSGSITTTAAWVTVPFSYSVTAGVTYHLAIWGGTFRYHFWYGTGQYKQSWIDQSFTFPTWEDPQSTPANYFAYDISAYIEIAGAAGGYDLTITQGSYSLTGQSVGLKRQLKLSCNQGSYSLSGQAVALKKGVTLPINQGAYTLSGQSVNFKRALKVSLNNGSYSLSGQTVGLKRVLMVSVSQGSYSLSGQDIAYSLDKNISITQGSYLLSGQTLGLKRQLRVSISQGSYSLSGQSIAFNNDAAVTLQGGTYSLSGQPLGLKRSLILSISKGSYTLDGQGLNFEVGKSVNLETGNFVLSGQSVTFVRGLRLSIDSGVYSLNGQAVNFSLQANRRRYILIS